MPIYDYNKCNTPYGVNFQYMAEEISFTMPPPPHTHIQAEEGVSN